MSVIIFKAQGELDSVPRASQGNKLKSDRLSRNLTLESVENQKLVKTQIQKGEDSFQGETLHVETP